MLLPLLVVEQHSESFGRGEAEVMSTLRTDAEAGREILVVDDVATRRALDPEALRDPALARRRLDWLPDLLEPRHYWSIYQRRLRLSDRRGCEQALIDRPGRGASGSRHVVAGAFSHVPDLTFQVGQRLLAPRQIELRSL